MDLFEKKIRERAIRAIFLMASVGGWDLSTDGHNEPDRRSTMRNFEWESAKLLPDTADRPARVARNPFRATPFSTAVRKPFRNRTACAADQSVDSRKCALSVRTCVMATGCPQKLSFFIFAQKNPSGRPLSMVWTLSGGHRFRDLAITIWKHLRRRLDGEMGTVVSHKRQRRCFRFDSKMSKHRERA